MSRFGDVWKTLLASRVIRVQPAPTEIIAVEQILQRYRRTDEVDAIVTTAWHEAVRERVAAPTPARLLLAALEDEAIAACFADPPAARRMLGEAIAAEAAVDARPELLGQILTEARTRARGCAHGGITRGDLLHGIARTGGTAARLLAEAAIDPARLDVRDDVALGPAPGPDDAKIAVHVLDDDATAVEDVMRTLEEAFELSRRRAIFLTLRTHCVGNARVGVYRRPEADDRIAHAKKLVAARGAPLAFVTTKI